MLGQALNDLNPHSLISASAAKEIMSNCDSYKIISKLNELIQEAAFKGQSSVILEVIRNKSYDFCKAYQIDPKISYVVKECRHRGFEVFFTLNQDSKTDEFYGDLLLSWNK
jgi:DNA-binding sugar fermentation-stimulating protein